MKKLLLFYSLFNCSANLFANDPAIIPVMNINGIVELNSNTQFPKCKINAPYNLNNLLSVVTFDSLRSIDEVNDLTSTDAFPWISLDGLRLYFTHQTLSPGLFYSERLSINGIWSVPVSLGVSGSSFTLSRNELELFSCEGPDIVHYSRPNLSSPFINPQQMTLNLPQIPNLYRSVSFDPSGAQMFLYAYYTGYTKAFELTRASQLVYNYTRELTFPAWYSSSSGRLSVDGLVFYLALNDTNDIFNLATMERASPFDTFNVASTQFIPELIDSTLWTSHPCASQNDEWLVFTRAISNTWSETNLYIASKTGVINSVSDNMKLHGSVYPNPANDVLNFRFNTILDHSTILNIYSIDGKLCISESINAANQAVIDVSELNSGLYFYSLNSGNEVYQDKLIIQK